MPPALRNCGKTVKEFVSWKEISQEDPEGYSSYRSRDTDQRKDTSVDLSSRSACSKAIATIADNRDIS